MPPEGSQTKKAVETMSEGQHRESPGPEDMLPISGNMKSLSAYPAAGNGLDARGTAVNKTEHLCLPGAGVLEAESYWAKPNRKSTMPPGACFSQVS